MPNSPIIIALLAFSLLSCLFAFLKGGPPERIGAGVIFANLVLMLAGQVLLSRSVLAVSQLTLDALTAVALLVLAVRYASFWLGAVMMLYALQFALHAFYFVTERASDLFHVIVNNLDFLAVSISLALGTAFAWRRRAGRTRSTAHALPSSERHSHRL